MCCFGTFPGTVWLWIWFGLCLLMPPLLVGFSCILRRFPEARAGLSFRVYSLGPSFLSDCSLGVCHPIARAGLRLRWSWVE